MWAILSILQMNIIQIYVSKTEYNDDKAKKLWGNIKKTISKIRMQDMKNGKIGNGMEGEFVGPYGLRERN